MDDSPFQESPFTRSRYKAAYSYNDNRGSKKRVLYIFLVLLLAGALAFGAIQFLGNRETKKEAAPTPTPTETVFPTETPTPTASVTSAPTGSSTPSPKPTTAAIDKTTGLDRSLVRVEVQNGSGAVGAASKGADTLKSLGYKVVTTGNADNFNYENVTIVVTPSFAKYLPLLKTDLGKQYTIGSTSATLSSSTVDARVIIGK